MPPIFHDPPTGPLVDPKLEKNKKTAVENLLPYYKENVSEAKMPAGFDIKGRENLIQDLKTNEQFRKDLKEIITNGKPFKLDLVGKAKENENDSISISIVGTKLRAAYSELKKFEGLTSDIHLTFEALPGLTNKYSEKHQIKFSEELKKVLGENNQLLKGLSTHADENLIIIRGARGLASSNTNSYDSFAKAGYVSIGAGGLGLALGVNLNNIKFIPTGIEEININVNTKPAEKDVVSKLAEVKFENNLSISRNEKIKCLTCDGYGKPTLSSIKVEFKDGNTSSFQMLSPNVRISYKSFEISDKVNELENKTYERPLTFIYKSKEISEDRPGAGAVIYNKDGNPTSLRLTFDGSRIQTYKIPYEKTGK